MKKLIISLVVIVAAAGGWSYWSQRSKEQATEAEKAAEGRKELEQKILSFTIDGRSPKGARQWHLEGNSAEFIDDAIHLNDLTAIAYGDNTTVNLSSDSGIYRKEKGEVTLIGNVKVLSSDGTILTTEEASWSQTTKQINSDVFVRVVREGMIATGTGASASSDEEKATLKKEVTVIMEPDTKVECDGPLEVSAKENLAVFYNNVKVKDKDGELYGDKLTVHFDPETQHLAQVVAEGNVKVLRGKSYTLSEKAVYTESTKSAKLTGKPRIIIDPDEIDELRKASEGS